MSRPEGSRRSGTYDLVVDVRSRVEFFFGHLPGAVCIPYRKLTAKLAGRSDVTPSSRILVYCASGARSAVATNALRMAGYRNVVDGGGIAGAQRHLEG